MQHKPFIITIVGPESSGKSTLARELASRYGAPWVPEYARRYLEGLGRPYQENDLNRIAEGQLEAISEVLDGNFSGGSSQSSVGSSQLAVGSRQLAVLSRQLAVGSWQSSVGSPQSAVGSPQFSVGSRQSSVGSPQSTVHNSEERTKYSFLTFQREEFGEEPRPIVVVDSGMLTLRMWARIKYGITIPVVEQALKDDVTSLYILCRPMIEWEADPLREAPKLLDRVWIYNLYLKELNSVR